MRILNSISALLITALVLPACGTGGGDDAGGMDAEPAPAITNRIDVPPAVRRNLGITFAKVAPRHVTRTRRLPGSFEFSPEARRAYHITFAGQVELQVEQYKTVQVGDALFRVDSPQWRELQKELAATVNAIRTATTQQSILGKQEVAIQQHAAGLIEQRGVWTAEVKRLEKLADEFGGVSSPLTDARAQLAVVLTSLAEVAEEQAEHEGKLSALQSELDGYRRSTPLLYADALGQGTPEGTTRDLSLSRAAALLGVSVAHLRENVGSAASPMPRWRMIDRIEVKAQQAGVVEHLHVTNGAWVEVGGVVIETVDTAGIRFRASGLQADLGELRDGLSASIQPPGGSASRADAALHGVIAFGVEADPRTRKIDVIVVPAAGERPAWARAGVSTEVEVVLYGSSEAQLAIPVASVIQDGLEKVIFRRDPKSKDKVIRLTADLGVSDGRWVVVESGVMEGDEIVHHGVYELKLASGSAKQEGGHFHADGTFHVGDDH